MEIGTRSRTVEAETGGGRLLARGKKGRTPWMSGRDSSMGFGIITGRKSIEGEDPETEMPNARRGTWTTHDKSNAQRP